MRLIALIVIIYILADIQRRVKEKGVFVTQKQFGDFKAAQAAIDTDYKKRLEALESSSFA